MKNKLFKTIIGIIILISTCCLFASCSSCGENGNNNGNNPSEQEQTNNNGDQNKDDKDYDIVSLKLNPNYAVLEVGETVRIAVLNASGTVQWQSSNPLVCEVADGLLTAKAEGGAVITATDGSASATCRVVVQNSGIVAVIEVENSEINIFIGNSLNIGAEVKFKAITVDSVLTYVSADSSIATVDINGRVTGVGVGETYINIYDNDRGLNETVKVKVMN